MSWISIQEMYVETAQAVLTSPNLPFALTMLARVYGILLGLTLAH